MKAEADVILGLWRVGPDANDRKAHLKMWNLLFSHLVFIVSSEHPLAISVVFTTAAEASPSIHPFYLSLLILSSCFHSSTR